MNYSSQFPFSNGLPGGGDIVDMIVHDIGNGPELFVGGEFNGPLQVGHVGKWNGTNWSGFADGPGQSGDWVAALEFFNDGTGEKLYAGGSFSLQLPGVPGWTYMNLASWDGTSWSAIPGFGPSPGAQVLDLKVFDDGSGPALYVVGAINQINGQYGISRYLQGVGWTSFGNGGADSWITTLAVFNDGGGSALYAAGNFTQIGGVSAYHIARWNGVNWAPVGTPADNINLYGLVPFDDGTGPALYASSSGPNKIVRWDGQAWSGVPGWPSNLFGLPLGTFDSGQGLRLIVGSSSPAAYEWNGSSWTPFLSEVHGNVYSIAEYDDRHGGGPSLYFAGLFNRVAGIESYRIGALRTCSEPIDTMCFGDGTVATCPCGNTGDRGNGCANSVQPSGARLTPSGLPGNDTLVLTTMNQPANSATIMLQATEAVQTRTPFGDGLLCLGGQLVRLFTRTAYNGSIVVPGPGDPTLRDRSAQRGDPLAPGDVRYYQAYYRDADAAFCAAPTGGTSNTTNGVRVVW